MGSGGMNSGGYGGFGGPAVLGRGVGSNTGARAGGDLGIRFYAGITATFDSGLTGFQINPDGSVISRTAKGVDGVIGAYGVKRFRRSQLGLNYQGGYHQSTQKLFNGTDQSLSLFYGTQLTRRSQFSINTSAGTTNRPIGVPILAGTIDGNSAGYTVPTNELFDNRFYYGNVGLGYTIQRSARLSFGVVGSGFITRRTGGVLFGFNGANAGANAAYRLSRRQTIYAGYQFFFYNYTRNFGDSYGNGFYGGYSTILRSGMTLNLSGGATRLESLGLRTVAIDPVIAALIGFSTTQEVYYGISYMPSGSATLSMSLNRRSNLSLNGRLFVSPGNGIINTSRNLSGSANYGYTGLRVATLGASVGYSRLSSVVGDHQSFETIMASGSASRRISGGFFFTATAGNRKFLQSSTNNFNRSSFFASFGVYWSPGEIPLSIR